MVVHSVLEVFIELNTYSKCKNAEIIKTLNHSHEVLTKLMLKNLQWVDVLKTSKAAIP